MERSESIEPSALSAVIRFYKTQSLTSFEPSTNSISSSHTEHHDRKHVMYAGRDPSASVATGLKAQHTKEESALLKEAFSVTQDKLKGE